jgi:hypothetical protein
VKLYGTVSLAGNPNAKWYFELHFSRGMNWTEWSSQDQPTSFKNDCESVDNHEDWMYFYLLPTSFATGMGDLEGLILILHMNPLLNTSRFNWVWEQTMFWLVTSLVVGWAILGI